MTYLPVRIGTLRPGAPVNFDIYILVGEKYVHYVRSADPFDPERIERLKGKGVKKLYIPEASENAYLAYLDMGLNQLQDKAIPVQERGQLVASTIQTEAENAAHNVETESGYKRTQDRIGKVVSFLTSESGALKTILGSTGTALDNFQHSANVCSMSLSLAGVLGITQARELLELGLAALLHDSALSKLGFAPDVDPQTLSGEQLKKYQEHPTAVAHHLAGKPYIDRNVLELIANHHEIGEGVGFPGKKRLSTLSLSSQALNLCDAFDHFWMTGGGETSKGTAGDAMKAFFSQKIGLFNLEHIKALQSVLK